METRFLTPALVLTAALFLDPTAGAARQDYPLGVVTTSHTITLDGVPLPYTARAGHIPIRVNETAEIHGYMFFVAYTVEPAPDATARPITFAWNGGPGAAASLVHLLGWGPKRLDTADTYPEFDLETQRRWSDNQGTWLGATDLVFVDPIGTGYSRPTRAEYGPEFYNGTGDAESVAEFIRVYLTRFDAWDCPIFLAGESYGTTRAQMVAEALERRGIHVAGVALVSGGLAVGQAEPGPAVSTALRVPAKTAAAFYHERLDPDLQENLDATLRMAEEWAENVYAAALARRDSLSRTERGAILSELSRFVGVPVAALDTERLSVDENAYYRELLADEGLTIGRYDARMTGPSGPPGEPFDPTKDPSLSELLHPVGVLRYMRNELGIYSDLLYQGPFGGGYPPPETPRGDWMSTRWESRVSETRSASGPESGGELPPLRQAMDSNRNLTVFVARGLFDSGGCAAMARTVRTLPAALAGRVRMGCYLGGHSFYTDKEPRLRLRRDMEQFIHDAVARSSGGAG